MGLTENMFINIYLQYIKYIEIAPPPAPLKLLTV